jgi:protein-S-isoprenylcysteine O-methyltransferase Ste14
MALRALTGKALYALLFNLLLPVLLILWAVASSSNVSLPVFKFPSLGMILFIVGIIFVILGMINLVYWGNGLPMNAYPPKNFVDRGIFRCFPHPIYTGAVISVAGASILFQSASGFWLVTPIFALGCMALVYGFEKEDMKKRLGEIKSNCLIKLPENSEEKADFWDYASVYILVFAIWFVLYEMLCLIGTNNRSISTFMNFEYSVPVIQWTEIFYVITYPFVLFVPLIFRKKKDLRKLCITGMITTFSGIFFQLAFPFMAPPRTYMAKGLWGSLLEFERGMDSAAAAFPSFHVIWAFVGAYFLSIRFSKKVLWYIIAIIISASCFTTGMHSLADIISGYLTFLFIINIKKVALAGLAFFEMIANSWHEWDFGRVRILNHGIYVGIGAAVGYMIISSLSGERYFLSIFYISVLIVVSAGLWAQMIEGSPKLSRPYGFYGGLVGAIIGIILTSWLTGQKPGLLWGSFAIAAPWIQISGRLRCLIQGCCHGREIHSEYGIKFYHPKSRVCRLAGLTNKPLHATQLYSIISNMFIGILLIRISYENASPELIAGIYLMLNGLSRFVEESYRGEPQTPIVGGLRLYQWLALASLITGAYLTTITSNIVRPEITFTASQVFYSIAIGVLTFFAMGVDFPKSNKRFARLA